MSIGGKNVHMSREKREQLIFNCILNLVNEQGLFKITINEIAKRAGCSTSLIKVYFGGIVKIRRKVLEHAKENKIKKILNTPVTDLLDTY